MSVAPTRSASLLETILVMDLLDFQCVQLQSQIAMKGSSGIARVKINRSKLLTISESSRVIAFYFIK